VVGKHIGLGRAIAEKISLRISHRFNLLFQPQFCARQRFFERVCKNNICPVEKVNQFGDAPGNIAHRFDEGAVNRLPCPRGEPAGVRGMLKVAQSGSSISFMTRSVSHRILMIF
jgi:hypothetical protein